MRRTVTTRSTNLNMRSGPGLQFPVVGSLRRGSVVDVIETRAGWCRLANGRWAAEEFLPAERPTEAAPSVPVSTRRPLPAFARLWQNYPIEAKEAVRRRIGGQVNDERLSNTCTIRLSRALNYSGHLIPRSARGLHTATGGDGLHYAYRVREMRPYLEAVYGPPHIVWRVASPSEDRLDRSDPREPFLRRRGIIQFSVHFDDATGHFDIWDGIACRFYQHFDHAYEIALWQTIG